MPGDAMIECEGLTKRFGHVMAVDHVSFKIEKGSIFGFLGPNGSGKSTVIRLLISTRAQNQIQALQMCVIFILPSVFFSGFIFPRETMPWIFYALGAVLPATYYIELQRAIVLRGASVANFWLNFVVLAGMGLAVFSLCALRFKQKLT